MWFRGSKLWVNDEGAVAPLVALSLVALLAIGGIAFDYARLASMDTELQDAADQAALAAATQLDGQSGACARAAAAASGLLTNNTFFANDGSGIQVQVPTGSVTTCSGNASIKFYQSYDQATDTPGAAASADSNAKIVMISVTPRQANFALTPIVAAFRSGNVNASAVATLSSAICKEPPVMICNPSETGTNTSFDPSAFIGDGLRLTSVGNGSGTWAPGNFGYLDTLSGVNGAPGLREALGWNTPPGECEPTNGVNTKPGATTTVTDALNTRFDIYENGNTSCPTGGSCSASINSIKDLRRPNNANGTNACKIQNQGWQLDTSGTGYYGQTVPSTAADLPTTTTPSSMGHPRDECHAISSTGSCAGGRMGDGKWDRDAYFRTNYVRTVATTCGAVGTRWAGGTGACSWQTFTGLSPTVATTAANYASRYNVYAWEIANRGNTVNGALVLGQRPNPSSGSTLTSYAKPVCSQAQTPSYGTGQIPDSTTPDRRRISVAVVNCMANGVKGNSTNVPVEKWIDVFLVEPSVNRARTNNGDMYVEVIGEAKAGGGSTAPAGQVIRHDVPVLIK